MLWGAARGPRVPPGSYRIEMTAGDWSQSRTVEVRPDPRLTTTPEQYQRQFDLSKRIWESLSESHRALRGLRDVRTQVEELTRRLEEAGHGEGLEEAAGAVTGKLTELEERIHQTRGESSQDILNFPPRLDNQLLGLLGAVQSADAEPTAGSIQRFDDLRGELDGLLAELQAVYDGELATFNDLVRAKQQPPVLVPGG